MADVFTKAKRSRIMASIRSKRSQTTELVFESILRQGRIIGWRRHTNLIGKPDYTFRKERVVIFIDGCFWHGCPKHGNQPKSNIDYWTKKLSRNRLRDRRVSAALRKKGWRVVRIWEHNLNRPVQVIARLQNILNMDQAASA
jgi:DNA mismatch endonuclease, patch repair protein